MDFLSSFLLGLLQGITEFLPISSTGHLTLVGKLLHLTSPEHPERWTAFIAVIQLGTLAAVLIYFKKDIWNIIKAFLDDNIIHRKKIKEQHVDSKLGWMIIVGTIPVVIIGLLFKDIIEGSLTKNLYVIASSLIGLALILAVSEKVAKLDKEVKDLSITRSLLIGIAQVFALIPGASRSGTTITGGLFVGLTREAAARFSFLLSIPAILGSGLLQFYEAMDYLNTEIILNLIVATLTAAVSGYLAIDFLLKFLRKNTTFVFIYYRIALGCLIIILLATNIIQP